jgi:hypothetical protein
MAEPEETSIASQRIVKQVPRKQIRKQQWNVVFSVLSVPRSYNRDKVDLLNQLSFETPASLNVGLGTQESRDGI